MRKKSSVNRRMEMEKTLYETLNYKTLSYDGIYEMNLDMNLDESVDERALEAYELFHAEDNVFEYNKAVQLAKKAIG